MTRTLKVLALALMVSFMTTAKAGAAPLWEFDTAGASFTNNNWDFAASFTVLNPLTVTGLGYYADPINGQVHENPVALFECAAADCSTTATLLTSAVVDNTYALTGHFRYVTVAPVNLEVGKSYQVAGVSFGNNYTWSDPGYAVDPNIALISLNGGFDRWSLDADGLPTFLNPGNSQSNLDGSDGYWGPNVFVGEPTFVPEPATIGLLGLGLLGAARRLRKRSTR